MKSSELFRERLLEAQGSQAMIAAYMASKNYNVRIKPCLLPNNDKKLVDDGGDLELLLNLQIKVRNLDFTSRKDYPFDTVLIDEAYKIERLKLPQLYGYLILNKKKDHACFVCAKTNKQWRKVERYDSKYKDTRKFYTVNKNFCEFIKL